MDVREAPTVTVHMLCDMLDTFISRNAYASDDAVRWFADYCKDALALAQRVRSGGLTGDDKKLIASFRLAELHKKKRDYLKEGETLDREIKKIERELT